MDRRVCLRYVSVVDNVRAGHYWAYIVDHASRQWFKFNDVTVTRVGNVDDMMRETWGDVHGSTSGASLLA